MQDFSEPAYNQMLNYNWRGNVRELQHSIERAVLLSRKGIIDNLDIPRTTETPASMDQFAEVAAARGAVAVLGYRSGGNDVHIIVAPKQYSSIRRDRQADRGQHSRAKGRERTKGHL